MGNETALVRVQATPAPFEPADLEQAFTLAENLSQASLLPQYLRGKPHDVFMTLLLGRDLGLTAMQAITGIHVIDGKPSVSAGLAVALVKRSPACRYFRLVEESDQGVSYETQRQGEPGPQRMSYTIEDAKRAGLLGKKNWQAYPRAMMRARCSMALARDVYPDVVANVYDPEELERGVIDVVSVEQMTAPPPRPASRPAPAPAVVPPPGGPAAGPAAANGAGAGADRPLATKSNRTAPCGTCGGVQSDHPFGAIDATCARAKPAPAAEAVREAVSQVPEQPAQPFEMDPRADRPYDEIALRMVEATTRAELEKAMLGVADLKRNGQITAEELEGMRRLANEQLARIRGTAK
jgi:hypothetical protein